MPASSFATRCLIAAGAITALGALVHVAIATGGPRWYVFFHAPRGIVAMAQAGEARAWISCLVIAAALTACALYAFSGAGWLRRLPWLRTVLATIAGVLIVRGLVFVPLIVWRATALAGVCDCQRLDAFLVATSLLCLAVGGGYAVGVYQLWRVRCRARA